MEATRLFLLPPRVLLQCESWQPIPSASVFVRALSALAPGQSALQALASLTQRDGEAMDGGAYATDNPGADELNAQQKEYDAYFGVGRAIAAKPADIFCYAVVVAYHRFLKECLKPHSLLPIEVGLICSALESLLHLFASPAESGQPSSRIIARPNETSPREPLEVDPLERWRLGHHVFFVLVQGLLIVHTRLAKALETSRLDEASAALAMATELWLATAASFRFAGDFSSDAYLEIVRPSMAPPHVSPGFSGLAFADHALLIMQLRALKPQFEALPFELRGLHRRYLWAFNAMYDAHAFVCSEFVANGKSLRRIALQNATQAEGPATIRGPLKRRVFGSAETTK